jgi:hypothetical protein
MAQLTEADKIAFRELTESEWIESPEERSPRIVEPTLEGRTRYIRWASEAAKFFKGTKPVDFSGDHWKL